MLYIENYVSLYRRKSVLKYNSLAMPNKIYITLYFTAYNVCRCNCRYSPVCMCRRGITGIPSSPTPTTLYYIIHIYYRYLPQFVSYCCCNWIICMVTYCRFIKIKFKSIPIRTAVKGVRIVHNGNSTVENRNNTC